MAFTSPFTFETVEQEAARLGQSHPDSINGRLAPLPVTIKHISVAQVIELPREHTSPREGVRTIVMVAKQHPRVSRPGPSEVRRYDHSFDCVVLASTDERYPVGGYDLCISEAELRRGRLVSQEALLNTREQG